ncbi:MAG: helix-turn-helix domain-containing protein [Cohaesibacteraceae bacterium]|nr:helix-turn-helix domain-containing protein [Cohaesibacteraceae bacterium]MBL4875057.1 helix-turn-helix domain-containing protein [Cohaesibacteraceae bacterium]
MTVPVPTIGRVEARTIRSGLTTTEYLLKGKRTHIFILKSGEARVFSEEGTYDVAGPGLIWLPLGKSSVLTLRSGTRGWMASIPDIQLGLSLPPGTIGSNIAEIINSPAMVQDIDLDKTQEMGSLISLIENELRGDSLAATTVVQYCLSLLLILYWRALALEVHSTRPLPRNIVHRFVFLVDLHLRDHWTVHQYSVQMGVSKDRLGSAVKRATGHSPLAHIHNRIIEEARTLLTDSGMHIAEVAYKLGYRDAGYFNRFFSRRVGISPGRFRQDYVNRRAVKDHSFAAWP